MSLLAVSLHSVSAITPVQQRGSPSREAGLPLRKEVKKKKGGEGENYNKGLWANREPEESLRALKFFRYQLTSLKQEVFSIHEVPCMCSVGHFCKQIPFKLFRLFVGTR